MLFLNPNRFVALEDTPPSSGGSGTIARLSQGNISGIPAGGLTGGGGSAINISNLRSL